MIADAKPEDEELVRSFGADIVVPRGPGFVAAVHEAAPDGVDGLYDTALLGRDVFAAIKDGGGMVVVRGWDGSQAERGIQIHPVMVLEVLERTDWLEDLASSSATDASSCASPASIRPNERPRLSA